MADAPYSGGFSPGGRIFAVSGDFTIADPCGAPEISYPLIGDSQPAGLPIIILDRTLNPPAYVSVPIGTGFNVQDFNNEQSTILIEQEFMVAAQSYFPMPLNALYNLNWSVGWGAQYQGLGNCFLVGEGPLVDVGGGIVRFKRKFCSLPPNRNEYESYNAQFPALDYGGDIIRFGMNKIVNSRIFYEYYVLDDADLLPGIPLFPAGHRITTAVNASLGQFMLIEETKFFKGGDPNAVVNNNVLDSDQPVTDDATGSPPAPTTPSYTTYATWANFNGIAGFASEIVAEASSFTRWMGNIHVRRTRFVIPQ